MGQHINIDHEKFPKQGLYLNKRVKVCFNYDTSHVLEGTVIRDDADWPGELIILLDDKRVVRAEECQYSPQ